MDSDAGRVIIGISNVNSDSTSGASEHGERRPVRCAAQAGQGHVGKRVLFDLTIQPANQGIQTCLRRCWAK